MLLGELAGNNVKLKEALFYRLSLRTMLVLERFGIAVVRFRLGKGGNNSVVECDLAKVEVAGSNPVSRSSIFSSPPPRVFLCPWPILIGAVAKW